MYNVKKSNDERITCYKTSNLAYLQMTSQNINNYLLKVESIVH